MTEILTTAFLPEIDGPPAEVLDRLRTEHRKLLRAVLEARAAGTALRRRFTIEDGDARQAHARAARERRVVDESAVSVTSPLARQAQLQVTSEREADALRALAHWVPSAVRALEAHRGELDEVAKGAYSGRAQLYHQAFLANNVLRGLDSWRWENEAGELLAQADEERE